MTTQADTELNYANLMDALDMLGDTNLKFRLAGKGATKNVLAWSKHAQATVLVGSVTGRTNNKAMRAILEQVMLDEEAAIADNIASHGYEGALAHYDETSSSESPLAYLAKGRAEYLRMAHVRERYVPSPQPSEEDGATRQPQSEAEAAPQWTFDVPALRGLQGGRAYYSVVMPYRVLARLLQIQTGFKAVERAQRLVTASRVQELVAYMGTPGYALPALTGSVSGKCDFHAHDGVLSGSLSIDMGAKIRLADGQHRASAIVAKVEADPTIGQESVIVQLYTNLTLAEEQQLFSDLNSKAVKPNASINNLYNHRKASAQIAKAVAEAVFPNLIDYERVTCSGRTEFLYPFKSLIDANDVMFGSSMDWTDEARLEALKVWALVAKRLPLANLTQEQLKDLRECSVLGTAAGLMVLAWVVRVMITESGLNALADLRKVEWSRDWHGWDGNVIVGSKMVKNGSSIKEGARQVLRHLGMSVAGVGL